RSVLQAIRHLNETQATTILICSHLLQQLETVCDRYLFIDEGRLIEQGTLSGLTSKYQKEVLLVVDTDLQPEGGEFHGRAFDVSEKAGLRRLTFRLGDRSEVPEFLRLVVDQSEVYGARIVEQGLEELYFEIRRERLA